MTIVFNHLNLVAGADSKVKDLFVNVLELQAGNRPNFPFKGEWLYQGDKALLHIIESLEAGSAVMGHIAFDTDMDLATLTQKLNQQKLQYNVRQVPDSPVIQVFIRLGDLLIELQTFDSSCQQIFDTFSEHQELI